MSFGAEIFEPLTAHATTVEGLKGQIEQHQNQLNEIYSMIESLEGEHDILQEEIDDLNAEIVNTMTSIGLKEDEITAKEAEIAQKEIQIAETEAAYEAAKEKEETQKANMAACARLMYESGGTSYLSALLGGEGFSDVLNRLDYIEKVYQYGKTLLLGYIDAKDQVQELWDKLLRERSELQADRAQLEADKADLQAQKASLDVMLEEKKRESANFAAEISQAQKKASDAKKQIQKEQEQLKKLEAQIAAQQAAQQAANATYATTAYSAVIDAAEGSELGKQIARFACQYIGNKYVYGGNSLTNGIDCSGFTLKVYQAFGYSLPRTSLAQRSAGKSVSYEDAQPGDLICYDGHVGMYIGGGLIVHASNSKPYPRGGIKVSKAQYREILSVRRIID